MVRKEADWEQFSASGKKLDGLTAEKEKNAQVTVEKGSHLVRSLVHLRVVQQVRRDQRHDTSEDQRFWALMRDQFQRCTGEGVVEPINKQKRINFEGCVDRWEKDEEYRKQMTQTDIQR